MKKFRVILMLGLFVILMTVFGSVFAQDVELPAFKVLEVVQDEKVVLTTKNFPAEVVYTISMAAPDSPDSFVPVARFNSKSGGSLNVTVKIQDKFKGLGTIELMLQDEQGNKILGQFTNIPEEPAAEEPVAEEPAVEQPAAEEPVAEEPAPEQPAEEPVAEEPVADEPAAEEEITLVNQNQPAEEPAAEEDITLVDQNHPAEEPAVEEEADQGNISLVNESVAPETAAPAEETAQEPAAEPASDEQAVPQTEETVSEEVAAENAEPLVCNFAVIPYVTIDAVQRNASVTFTTANFPADSTFTVSMGQYVSTWVPSREPAPRPHHHHGPAAVLNPFIPDPIVHLINESEQPARDFPDVDKPKDHHGHHPRGYVTSSFSGVEVGSFETGDGSAQTLTFEIPASLANANPIALWISDQGPCGFYAYNYFYNNSTY